MTFSPFLSYFVAGNFSADISIPVMLDVILTISNSPRGSIYL